jgi:C-terminal processing protease CtpA/Prc
MSHTTIGIVMINTGTTKFAFSLFITIAIATSTCSLSVIAKDKHLKSSDAKQAASDTEAPGGVGMEIGQDQKTGHFVVRKVLSGTSAAKAKISEGDRILEIGGVAVDGMHMDEIVEKIRGKVGSKFKLTIASGEKKRKLTLTRKAVGASRVKLNDGGSGY